MCNKCSWLIKNIIVINIFVRLLCYLIFCTFYASIIVLIFDQSGRASLHFDSHLTFIIPHDHMVKKGEVYLAYCMRLTC